MPPLAALLLGAALILLGCSNPPATAPQPRPSGALSVIATIPPVRGIIEPLLKGAAMNYDLQTLIPPGVSEHGHEIAPDKLAALGKADIVIMVGLGMEPQVEKFLAQHPRPERRVVVLADSVKSPLEHADDHDADHDHHASDPHVWLDPINVEAMVMACAKSLKEAVASDAAAVKRLDEAQAAVLKRVAAVDSAYASALAQAPRHTIIVSHDAYGYLAHRYHLEVVAITGLNAGEPQPADVKKAADTLREKRLTTIFIEPQLSPAAAYRIAQAVGARTAVLDPLGDGDWFMLMDRNLRALKDALGTPAAEPTH
jgi:zinc transport system substrate-binding protein